MHEVLAQEDLVVRSPGHRADLFGHAPLTDHADRQFGIALEVVGGAGGQVAVDEELGHATAHAHAERVLEVLARHDVAVLFGQRHRHAEGHPARDDRDLVQGIGLVEDVGQQRVSALVIGDALALVVHQDHGVA